MSKTSGWFVVNLIAMAASAAVLILLIPSWFRSGEQPAIWLYLLLASLALIFGVGALRLRPSRPTPPDA